MFGPALWVARSPRAQAAAPALCAALLALGSLVLLAAPGPFAWWGLTLAHGGAWSVAWAAQLTGRRAEKTAAATALRGAFGNALFALALGLGVASQGLQALSAWHLGLGLLAAMAATALWSNRGHEPHHPSPRH